MDTFTHALSGALLARAVEPSATPGTLPRRTRMWTAAWAAAFPDSDFVLQFIDPLTYLTAHRGETHSIVLLPLWAFGLALLMRLLVRGRYPWRAFIGACALGIAVHIAGDVITSFGTMVFAPLSAWRAQLPVTFIIDPYFTAILAVGLLASARWKDTRVPAAIGLAVLVAYIGGQALLRERAERIGAAYIAANKLDDARAHALPQPFAPFNWMVVVEQPRTYRLSYVSLVRDEIPSPPPPDALWLRRVNASYRPVDKPLWREIPRYGNSAPEIELATQAWDADVFARYRRFAMFPAVFRIDRTQDRTCVWFNDLRFALPERRVLFRYGTCRTDERAPWKVYHLDQDGGGVEVLQLIE